MHKLRDIRVAANFFLKVNRHTWRLRRLGHVDNFLQSRHSQSDVLRGHSSVVEGVQRHLSCGFSDTLGGQDSCHLSRINHGDVEASFDFTDDPCKSSRREAIFFQDALAGQQRANQNTIVRSSVGLSLDRKGIIASDNNQSSQKAIYRLNDISRRQVRRLTSINTKLTRSILNSALDVSGSVRRIVRFASCFAAGHHNAQNFLVFAESFQFAVQYELHFRVIAALVNDFGKYKGDVLIVVSKISVCCIHGKLSFEFGLGKSERVKILALNPYCIHTVFAVQELNNHTATSTERPVVVGHDSLHSLHKTTLNVSSLSCFTGRIDQTLTTTHGVKEEFLGRQTAKV